MRKNKTINHRRINWRDLILGLILNILVIIVAFIIYHEVFSKPETGYFPVAPLMNNEAF